MKNCSAVTIRFETGNAAFEEPEEISRILRVLAHDHDLFNHHIDSDIQSQSLYEVPIFDENGNRVGEMVYHSNIHNLAAG